VEATDPDVEEICMMEIEEIDFVVLRFRQNFME
jgi:hypothetical protein